MKKYNFYKEEDKKFPPIVHLETTNICNLKCIHCFQSDPNYIKYMAPRTIDLDIFRKVANEVGKNNGILRLTSEGEPSSNKDWDKEIEIALSSGCRIFAFNTNGLLIDKKSRDALLVETNTNIAIEFSIDALYSDTYSKIRGGNYYTLLKNIFALLEERDRKGRKNVKILVSCIMQPEVGDEEYDQFVKFWTPLVDKVISRRYSDTNGLTEKKLKVQINNENRWPCPFPFTRIVVGIGGDIRFCPCDVLENTNIADIKESTLEEVWTSSWMNNIRSSHLNGTFDGHPHCKTCTHWNVLKWGDDYVKALNELFY